MLVWVNTAEIPKKKKRAITRQTTKKPSPSTKLHDDCGGWQQKITTVQLARWHIQMTGERRCANCHSQATQDPTNATSAHQVNVIFRKWNQTKSRINCCSISNLFTCNHSRCAQLMLICLKCHADENPTTAASQMPTLKCLKHIHTHAHTPQTHYTDAGACVGEFFACWLSNQLFWSIFVFISREKK